MVQAERDAHEYGAALLLSPRARKLAGVAVATSFEAQFAEFFPRAG